jgi:hypothetical protein
MRHRSLVLFILLALAALVRFWDLPSMEFKGDEQGALTLGIRLIEERPWATSAPWPRSGLLSSTGIANPPFFNWVMALLWGVTRDPVWATAMVALANWLALFPMYLWAERRLGAERALVFLGVLSLSPFAVLYSRKLWAQDLLFPALTLVLWGFEWMRARATFWRGVACLLWGAVPMTQLHQSGPIALVVAVLAALVQWAYDIRKGTLIRVGRPSPAATLAILSGVGAFLFFWLPYLDYLNSLPPEALADRLKAPIMRPQLLRRLLFQVVPVDLSWFFLDDMKYFFSGFDYDSVAWTIRNIGYYGAIVTGTVAGLYGVFNWIISPFSLPFVGVWWIGIILVFTLARIPSYPHYVLILSPLPALLIAGGFEFRNLEKPRLEWIRWVRWAYVTSLGLLTFGMLFWIGARGGSSGDFGVTYRVRLQQAEAIASGTEARAYASDLHCEVPNSEVRWLLVHELGAPEPADRLRLCEGWRDQGADREYVWAIRR